MKKMVFRYVSLIVGVFCFFFIATSGSCDTEYEDIKLPGFTGYHTEQRDGLLCGPASIYTLIKWCNQSPYTTTLDSFKQWMNNFSASFGRFITQTPMLPDDVQVVVRYAIPALIHNLTNISDAVIIPRMIVKAPYVRRIDNTIDAEFLLNDIAINVNKHKLPSIQLWEHWEGGDSGHATPAYGYQREKDKDDKKTGLYVLDGNKQTIFAELYIKKQDIIDWKAFAAILPRK